MAKRSSNQARGDLGELEVSMRLIEAGVSINTLTQSDTGWDLHLHVPEEPVDALHGAASWAMSGRVAYAQVKRRSSDTWPRVRVGTARGWITSTRAGVPSFLFMVDARNRTATTSFATAADLEKWLGEFGSAVGDEQDASTRAIVWHRFDAGEPEGLAFGRLLHLWTRFPNVMLELDPVVADEILLGRPITTDQAVDLLAPLASTCLNAHGVQELDDGIIWRNVIDGLVSAAACAGGDDDALRRALLMRLSDTRAVGGGWNAGVLAGAFSRRTDPHEIQADAEVALEEIVRTWATTSGPRRY